MKNVLSAVALLVLANVSFAQCENGRCALPQFQFSRFSAAPVVSASPVVAVNYDLGFRRGSLAIRYDLGGCAQGCNAACATGAESCSTSECTACDNSVAQSPVFGVHYGSTLLSGGSEVRAATYTTQRRQPRFRFFSRLRGGCGCR